MSENALSPGNVAVITGAASGIGLACAKLCALRYSMRVVLLDADEAELERVASELSQDTMETILDIECDVTDFKSWQKAKERIWNDMGGCHFLFLNAGIGGSSMLQRPDEWKHIFDVNVFGVLYGMQVFVPEMIKQGTPSVVATTASRLAYTNPPGDAAYTASKAALVSIAQSVEHHLRNLPLCLVESRLLLPGMTQTRFRYNALRRSSGEDFAESTPTSRKSFGRNAVSPEVTAKMLLENITSAGPFYIVGEDGDMSSSQFDIAVRWSAEDLIQRRPPLSRWLEPYRSEFLAKL